MVVKRIIKLIVGNLIDGMDEKLGNLFDKLHSLMKSLAKDIEEVIEENREISTSSVRELRDKISERLGRNEEIEDNKKLLRLLNLFAMDKAVMEILKEDSDEWIALLNDIEENLSSNGKLTQKERKEIKEIRHLTSEIKMIIRR